MLFNVYKYYFHRGFLFDRVFFSVSLRIFSSSAYFLLFSAYVIFLRVYLTLLRVFSRIFLHAYFRASFSAQLFSNRFAIYARYDLPIMWGHRAVIMVVKKCQLGVRV